MILLSSTIQGHCQLSISGAFCWDSSFRSVAARCASKRSSKAKAFFFFSMTGIKESHMLVVSKNNCWCIISVFKCSKINQKIKRRPSKRWRVLISNKSSQIWSTIWFICIGIVWTWCSIHQCLRQMNQRPLLRLCIFLKWGRWYAASYWFNVCL